MLSNAHGSSSPPRFGDPRVSERIWGKAHVDAAGCWTWTAAKARGYGRIYGYANGQRLQSQAHRVVYELLVGPIPEGLYLDHLCRNRACINPAHLEPVTHRENLLRGETVVAANARRTHCPQGHPYSGDNLSADSTGRRCKQCMRDRAARKRDLPGMRELQAARARERRALKRAERAA